MIDLMTVDGIRSVAQERVKAVAETEETRRAKLATSGGWTGTSRCTGDSSSRAAGARMSDPVSRLEHRLEVQQGHGRGGAEDAGKWRLVGEPTASIRRNIQFLEDCDRYRKLVRSAVVVAHGTKLGAMCRPKVKGFVSSWWRQEVSDK